MTSESCWSSCGGPLRRAVPGELLAPPVASSFRDHRARRPPGTLHRSAFLWGALQRMIDQYGRFEGELLRWLVAGPRGVPIGSVSTAITGLLVVAHPTKSIRSIVRDNIARGRYKIDDKFIQQLFKSAPAEMRLQLLSSAAAWWALPRSTFSRLFSAATSRKLSEDEKHLAAAALLGRLNSYPHETRAYAHHIRSFLRESNQKLLISTMPSVAKLPRLNRCRWTKFDPTAGRARIPDRDHRMFDVPGVQSRRGESRSLSECRIAPQRFRPATERMNDRDYAAFRT